MEELQARHRKEQRDLQSRITQKKKQASKKTRKGVNDECDRLETELKDRQAAEVAALNGNGESQSQEDNDLEEPPHDTTAITPPPTATELPQSTSTAPSELPRPSNDSNNNNDNVPSAKKPNRQKARLARRAAAQAHDATLAAESAKDLPDLKAQERTRMLEAMTAYNLAEHEIRADGHCLYAAIADQLQQLAIPLNPPTAGAVGAGSEGANEEEKEMPYKLVRRAAAQHITAHADDYAPFLEEPIEEYVRKVRDTGEWGGEVELRALAAAYKVGIWVLRDFGRVERIEGEEQKDGKGDGGESVLWLGYYQHGFGLGEHYNSLRRMGKQRVAQDAAGAG
ncbi:hypothetical protein B0A50_02367 [Salinomyces thailandicus]|uniref:OTU domain-containing protein n=1 Tax=Salinomyces thailandicus TaxID=706561 RepID=A0A4U0U6Q2_9PEZI|nr:hypothetical protein B0A50_02367 [Salinomyces thailandica]